MNPQEQQQEQDRLDQPPALPTLPDLDALRAPALARLKHFTEIRDAAQAEIAAAEKYLGRLDGQAPAARRERLPRQTPFRYSDACYRSVLSAVGNHAYAGIKTVSSESGHSIGHVAQVLQSATERGHVHREKHGRRYRFRITDAGTEFATEG